MVSLVFGDEVLENLVEVAISRAIERISSQRRKDEHGRVLWTKAEVAEAMGVSQATIDRWRQQGLPFVQMDSDNGRGLVLFRPESVREWVKSRETSLSNGG